ncbi:MAG: DNA methyltransferase, partial [Beggiatoa sp. IS2]
RPDTFFYLDPPYAGCENYYGDGYFGSSDFALVADLLAGMKGKFLLSINDTPTIRKLFNQFKIEEVATSYSLNGASKRKKVTELLIRNYS